LTALWLVRHGEPTSTWGHNSSDPALSTLGHKQSEALVPKLAQLDAKVLVSSPKLRAIETAAPFSNYTTLSANILPAIRELPSDGISHKERPSWLKQTLLTHWTNTTPEILRWRQGIWDWARSIEQPTIAFSHFVVINALKSFENPNGPVVQLLPSHASISHFEISNNTIEWQSTSDQLPSSVIA